MEKSGKKRIIVYMNEELDKKRLLAILEIKNKLPRKGEIIELSLEEDLYAYPGDERGFVGVYNKYEDKASLISSTNSDYIGSLLLRIETETHKRFQLVSPFPHEKSYIRSYPFGDESRKTKVYDIKFNPSIKEKTLGDHLNEIHFELKGKEFRMKNTPFQPIVFNSDIKVAIIRELANEKTNGPLNTQELIRRSGAQTAKTIGNYISDINTKISDFFKIGPDEFIPKSTPGAGYKLGDRVFVDIKE